MSATASRSRVRARRAGSLALLALAAGCGEAPPTEADATRLLHDLDDAFNRSAHGDFAGLFADVPQLGGAFERARRLVPHGGLLRQSSQPLAFAEVGGAGVVRADITIARADRHPDDALSRCVQPAYVAFRSTASGARIVLWEPVDADAVAHVSGGFTGSFSCPPCNFRIGSDQLRGWLVVPSPKLVHGSVELVAFCRPGADLRLAISVHRNDHHDDAPALLHAIVERPPCEDEAGIVARGDVEPWLPEPYRDAPPAGLAGAHCAVTLAGEQHCDLYLLTLRTPSQRRDQPEICYLLSVRGAASALAEAAGDVATWLASFRLLDPEATSDAVGAASAQEHCGRAEVAPDGVFRHPASGVSCRGPATWNATLIADRCRFGVAYSCPSGGGSLNLTAYERDPGTEVERENAAYLWVADQLARAGLEIFDDTGWFSLDGPDAVTARARDLASRPLGQERPHYRRDRLLLCDDLLLVVDGVIDGGEAEEAYARLVESLRW